ncbi:hypothetical protein DPMN_161416 [Dreissena polymorpha]|uniref:Uncharacterized protein n=1 Tax=Dreissena polymorpha TaxID=45954 RepID=A0A9D4EQD8_DREPO|nr:hypothetical protein DPMN_161416 [Dreissena polymorpha]
MVCESGNHFGNICEWNWNCGSSYHKGRFQRADMESFTFAFSQAVQLMGKMGSLWVAHLMTEIEKQYTRQNDGYNYNRRDDGYYYDRRDDDYYYSRRNDGYYYDRR